MEEEIYHIFLRTLNGKTSIFWIKGSNLMANLKQTIQKSLDIYANAQILLF